MGWKELSTSILPDSPLARCPESPFQGGIHITDGNCNRFMPIVRINFLGSPSGARGTVVSVCALHGPKRLGSSPGTRAPWRWHATNNKLWRVASQFSLCLFPGFATFVRGQVMELKASRSTLSIVAKPNRFSAHILLVTQAAANSYSCTKAHAACK